MKKGYIPKEERKNILFLSDDPRLPSGIGTMSREIIMNNAHRFNFYILGSQIGPEDGGKVLSLSDDINKSKGLTDSEVLLYPFEGYGNPDVVRALIERHEIDAIFHFTDPRYWIWLYRMSAEIRQKMPIFYYHIWDDIPAPHYNKPYYQSCDLLMGISRQSNNIAKLVLGEDQYIDLDNAPTPNGISSPKPKVCWIPHGVDSDVFTSNVKQEDIEATRKEIFGEEDVEFLVFSNNRNIRRKMHSDLILAFKMMYDVILKNEGEEKANKIRLLLHTEVADPNGTNLRKVIQHTTPEIEHLIKISNVKLSPEKLNLLYNLADVTVNIASNEGWGLSSTESLMAGTPIVNNVTGGLQDQCRFEDDNGDWIQFDEDFGSNHQGRYKKCGRWANPVFPASINYQGSIPTPYIFDDRCNITDVSKAIYKWYQTPQQVRVECGAEGSAWARGEEAGFTADRMSSRIGDAMTSVLDNWQPQPRFNMYTVKQELENNKNRKTGIYLPSYE